MAEIGRFFVKIGSEVESKGFVSAKKAILGVSAAATAAGVALLAMSLKVAHAAGVQEQNEKLLAEAMKQAGTYTEEAYKANLKYASALQKVTTFGDEQILNVQRLLTNFGLEGAMLNEVTKATLDLAVAKGMDLTAAADLVAKSIGSSTNALTRYGIEVEGSAGSTERARMAVENITKIFGGSAKAKAETYLGAIDQLKNIWGDFFELLGKQLLPSFTSFVKFISSKVIPSLVDFVNDMTSCESITSKFNTVLNTLKVTLYSVYTGFDLSAKSAAIFAATLDLIKAVKERSIGKMAVEMTNIAIKWKELKDSANNYKNMLMGIEITRQSISNKKASDEKTKIEAEIEREINKHETLQELLNIEQENQINRLEVMDAIEADMKERKEKREKEAFDLKVQRVEDYANIFTRSMMDILDMEVYTIREGLKAFGSGLKRRLIQYIAEKQQELAVTKVVELAKAVMHSATTWGAASYQIGIVLSQYAIAMAGLSALMSFDKGGIVPGKLGQPQLAVVHGGERIIPNKGNMSGASASGYNITVNMNQFTSMSEARRQANLVGDVIMRKVRAARRVY